jgi:hypothetical protein
MPVDNRSFLNIPMTIKIITLTNRTLIETSVLVVYLLIYYLIFNPPLLCTSSWRFEICLPSLYNLIEFSPNDQNTPKLFLSIKHTDIYISSNKFVLNRPVSMEVWFDTFPLSWWCDSILNNSLRIFLVARYRAVGIVTRVTCAPRLIRSKKLSSTRNQPPLQSVVTLNC